MNALPHGWSLARIGDLIAADGIFVDGDWVETKDQDPSGSVRLTQLADVGEGRFRGRSARFLTQEAAARLRCTFLAPGDVLVARMPDPLGRACLFPGDSRLSVTAVDVCIIRPGAESIEPAWLMWWINTPQLRSRITALQAGTTRKRISRKNLASIEFPVPPMNEQRRIVSVIEEQFSRLDAAEASLGEALPRLAALQRVAIVDALGDHWPEVSIGDVAAVDSGPAFKSAFFGGPNEGIRLLRGENIEPGGLRWRETRTWPLSKVDGYQHLHVSQTDVILAMDRPVISTGLKVARVRSSDLPALLVQRVARIRPSDRLSTDYLYATLRHPGFVPHLVGDQTGTQIPHITLAGIRSFQIRLPPLDEQHRIVERIDTQLSAIDALRSTVERAQRRAAVTRRAVLERAFRGDLVQQEQFDEPASALLERIRAGRTGEAPSRRRRRVSA
jgi:type I restriction enzyme, S subunit